MPAPTRKYALDSNVFIDAFREQAWSEHLQVFHAAFAPFEYLSAIVAQELRAGARSAIAATALQRNVFDVFERRGRVFAPSYAAWKLAGAAIARLGSSEGFELHSLGKGFTNDAVLAASCQESGVTLITRNIGDFARLRRVLPFRYVEPWPAI